MIITFFLLLGLFVLTSYTSANTAGELQPAETSNVGIFNSIKIGSEEEGGVTFFNGTIINIGETAPVTFGDDVRIDGAIWRGTANDDQPVKISDNLEVSNKITTGVLVGTLISSDSITSNTINSDVLTVVNFQPSSIYYSNIGASVNPFDEGHFRDLYAGSLHANYIDYYYSEETNSKPNPSLSPKRDDGTVRECTKEYYGKMIFSDKVINGGEPNQFYGCTGTGWKEL